MRSSSLKEVGRKDSENASNSSSNGEGGGNNSDNSAGSALVSLGNNSFGFSFESDCYMNNSSGSNSPDEGDSDQGDRKPKANRKPKGNASRQASEEGTSGTPIKQKQGNQPQQQPPSQPQAPNSQGNSPPLALTPLSAGAAAAAKIKSDSLKPLPEAVPPNTIGSSSIVDLAGAGSHQDAAATAVANLNQIATEFAKKKDEENEDLKNRGLKRESSEDIGGYNSDFEGEGPHSDIVVKKDPYANDSDSTANGKSGFPNKKKKLDDNKREERNAREKERSFRISRQINELRTLLSSGGVIVPKGTKSSVLTEAANYIRMLQQHQYRSEIDRHQLVQQVQTIGSGALGPQAATAVRHVAAQNGVWSLGNFGGVPPKSAMMYHQPSAVADEIQSGESSNGGGPLSNTIEQADYRHVFNSCTIGMAIASMGGAFTDCNKFFCQIAGCSKQEICSLTVFNLTARNDLQSAFDLISQMLSAPLDPTVTNTSCVLRGALRNRSDVGLSVKLVKANDGVAKCFCVTLIQNPISPFDTSNIMPATYIPGQAQGQQVTGTKDTSMELTPAYTTG